jgi:hypothetical protein
LVYQKARAAVKQWHEEWKKNNSYLQAARNALNAGKWQQAISNAKQVMDTPYWQQQIEAIVQQAEAKIAASKSATIARSQSFKLKKEASRTAPKRGVRAANTRRTAPKRVVRAATVKRHQRQPAPAKPPRWVVETR